MFLQLNRKESKGNINIIVITINIIIDCNSYLERSLGSWLPCLDSVSLYVLEASL